MQHKSIAAARGRSPPYRPNDTAVNRVTPTNPPTAVRRIPVDRRMGMCCR
ncbi:hypothetical protein [Lysobacter gummosus]